MDRETHRRQGSGHQSTGAEHDALHQGAVEGGDHAAAGDAAVHRMAQGGVHDLGHLDKPGAVLRNTIQKLAPGQTLRFTTSVNQIWGLGDATVTGGLVHASREIAANQKNVLGSQSQQEYSFTMPKSAKPGELFKVTFPGHYQVRSDPDWAFSFRIACA